MRKRCFLFLFLLSLQAQAQAQVALYDFELLKSWFIDSKNEVQLQLENKRIGLGIMANFDFNESGKVGTSYFLYSLANPQGPSPENIYEEFLLKTAVVNAVIQRRESVVTNIYPRTRTYSNGSGVVLMPHPLYPSFPVYVPMEKVDDESRPKDIYYDLLVQRLNSLQIVTSRFCAALFKK